MVPYKIIKELLRLPLVCESFSSRNILEVLAVIEGDKKVVRIPIKNHEWDILKVFCKKNNLAICHSDFKIAVVRETSLGDIFTENVTWESNSDKIVGFVAYVSMSQEISQLASDMESDADSNELGKLYQYPKCCIKTYADKIETGEFWLEILLSNSSGTKHSFYSNKIAYLFDQLSIISDYFPCSLNCEKTILMGKKYKNILLKNDLKDFYENIEKSLCKSILIGDGFLLRFEKNISLIDSNNSELFKWKNEDKYNHLLNKDFSFNIDYDLDEVFQNDIMIGKLYQFLDK